MVMIFKIIGMAVVGFIALVVIGYILAALVD